MALALGDRFLCTMAPHYTWVIYQFDFEAFDPLFIDDLPPNVTEEELWFRTVFQSNNYWAARKLLAALNRMRPGMFKVHRTISFR